MKPKVAVRNESLINAKNTLPKTNEAPVPTAKKVITIIPSGSSRRDLIQTRRLLIAGKAPPATNAHSVETPRCTSRLNATIGIATSNTSVGSNCMKLNSPPGGSGMGPGFRLTGSGSAIFAIAPLTAVRESRLLDAYSKPRQNAVKKCRMQHIFTDTKTGILRPADSAKNDTRDLNPGCKGHPVTPAQGGVEPTAGSTFNQSSFSVSDERAGFDCLDWSAFNFRR